MSGAGNPMVNDFHATRGRVATGGLSLDELAGGGGGAQTAAPAQPPVAGAARPVAAPPASDPALPFGLQVSNFLQASAARARAMVFQDDPSKRDKTLGDALREGIAGVPAEIGREFMDSLHAAGRHALPTNLQDLMEALQVPVPGGKSALDLVGAAFSPLTGALTSAVGRPVEQQTGVRRDVTGTILSLFAPGSIFGKASKFEKLAKIADEAGDVAKASDVIPPGGPSGPAGPAAKAADATAVPGAAPAAAATASDAASGAKPAPADAPSAEPPPRAFDLAGEKPGADLRITPEVRAKAGAFLRGEGTSPIDVHLDQLADPATRAQAVNDIAKVVPKDGVKPIDMTQMGAYSLNLTPDELMTQIRPRFPNDEVFAAAQMAQNAAAEQAWNFARTAKETGAPADVEKATRAYALFNEFAGAWRDAKTDWGRTGRIQQEAALTRSDYSKHIAQVIEDVGPDNVEEVVRRIAEMPDPKQVSPFVSSLRWMGSREGMMYGWYNWLLSHAVIPKKAISDASLAALNVATRYTAEKFGSGAVASGETAALVHGYVGSMKDALLAAGRALKAGQSQFEGEYQSLFDGRLLDRGKQLADGSPADVSSPTPAALEYLRMALPTSAIAAMDDFAKVANYRAELRATAFRSASRQALTGDAFQAHMFDRMNNVRPADHATAMASALRNTLQEPLDGVAQSLQGALDQFNIPIRGTSIEIPLGRILVPFTKIATNAMRFAYRSSPLPFAFPSPSWKAAMATGGATRDLALAQAGLGTSVSTLFTLQAIGGGITGAGPSSPDMRRAWLAAGNKPYHMMIGSTPVGYGHIEPLATTLGTIADTAELMRYAHDEDNSQLAVSLALGVGHAVLDKTYMSTLSEVIEAMDAPDTKGQRFAQNFITGLAVPGELAMVNRGLDPWLRAHNDLMSNIETRTPGFGDNPPLRNLWGDPIKREDGFPGTALGRMFSPVQFDPDPKAEPIDKWIWGHRDAFPDSDIGRIGLRVPPRVLTSDVGANDPVHVPLSLQQTDRLRVLAGNGMKNPTTGLGAKDALNALVTGEYPDRALQQQWNRATPERQALMVLDMWGKYRDGAKKALVGEDANLRDTIGAARQGRAALLKPSLEGTP